LSLIRAALACALEREIETGGVIEVVAALQSRPEKG
jgi:hypothetical protein